MGVSAGRVLLIPKGDWNAETTYTGLDWVRHNGGAWVCKNTCTNVEPTEENSDNWQIIARDGQSGSVINVDTVMSDTSENPVQNKVIKKYVDDHSTDVDTVMSDTSTNAVQNKVVKSYVDRRTTLDTSMSSTSTKAVQNKVIKKYVDEKHVNIDGITLTLDEAKNVIKLADALKDKIGTALQPESIVNNQITTETGYALDARQANPNIDGTLAKQVADLNGSLEHVNRISTTFRLFANIPILNGVHVFCVNGVGDPVTDSPYPDADGWWNVLCFGVGGGAQRMVQITSQVFKREFGFKGKNELWIRSLHDDDWSEWVKL